jgi:hypothetical protein
VITEVVQRWREGSPSWRPADERFDPRGFEVAAIEDDTTPRAFVEGHHYSRAWCNARFRFGLYAPGGALVGVAVFAHTYPDVTACIPGEQPLAKCELGRFVLLDGVKAFAETWFLARCLPHLRAAGIEGFVSFSDPVPRRNAAGQLVKPGHVGTIYQATNAVYLGRATPRTLHVLPDGRVLNARGIQKVRARERGMSTVVDELVALGARPLGPRADSTAWLRRWLPRLTRTMRHRGNHRYVFPLTRAVRRGLPAGQPYPKVPDADITIARAA